MMTVLALPALFTSVFVAIVLFLALASCGYNNIPNCSEQAKAWMPTSRTTTIVGADL